MTPYRSPAPAPVRPALTWWQRVLCMWLSVTQLEQFRWYRRHVGGLWCCHGRDHLADRCEVCEVWP